MGAWRTVANIRAGALALGALGAGFGLLTLAEARSAPGFSFGGTSWVGAVGELGAGWALIAAGMAESWRRPASRAGLLLAWAGIGWFFTDWNNPGLGESTGILNQNQMIANLTSRLNRSFTLFTFYVLNHAMSNTDGATTIAPNPYDLSHEYGRSSLDARHRFMMGGSFVVKGNIRLSPFIIVRSGAPFDITTGRDLLGDTVFTSRPAFAGDLTGAGIVDTAFGNFNLNAAPGALVIPRNYAQGPGYFTINLRVGRTFGFGPRRETSANAMQGAGGGGRGGDHGGGRGGPSGMRMGGGGGGFHSIFGDASTDHRFNLVLASSARNLLNSTNPGQYTGDLNSPFFGRANSLAGSFGPAANAGNRRIELQLRLMF